MKVLVVPDIHGSWNNAIKFIEDNKDKVDKVVTLGDYVDDWEEKDNGLPMITGFNKLISIARNEPDKFEILIGNHDNSYISGREGSNCSGHRFQYASNYYDMFEKNIDIIKVATEIDRIIFSHAGLTKEWWDRLQERLARREGYTKEELTIDRLNEMWRENHSIINHCTYNPFGDSVGESPIWIRPSALLRSTFPDCKYQVVGHTEIDNAPLFIEGNNNKIIICDNCKHDCGFILDTERNYDFVV